MGSSLTVGLTVGLNVYQYCMGSSLKVGLTVGRNVYQYCMGSSLTVGLTVGLNVYQYCMGSIPEFDAKGRVKAVPRGLSAPLPQPFSD